jgi:membrane protease YdiL (CAAX protease family)
MPGSEAATPTLADAAALAAVVLALTLAAGVIGGAARHVIVFQLIAVGAPVLVWARLHPAPALALLGLGRPRALAALGGAIAGAGVLLFNLSVVVPLVLWLLPRSPASGPELGALPLTLELATLALVPALCEELLFRGVVFRAVAARSLALALIVSPLLFALFHISGPRLLPTAAVGLVASLALWRSGSTWAAIACHFTNNAAVIAIAAEPALLALGPAWLHGAVGAALIAGGLAAIPGTWAINKLPRPQAARNPKSSQ